MLPKSSSTFLNALFYALVFLIPFGVRHLFSPGYFYGTEILLIIVVAGFFAVFHGIFWQKPKSLILFLLCVAVSVLFASDKVIATWWLARLLLLSLGSLVIAKMLRTGFIKEAGLYATIGASAVIQALIGLVQFWKQSSLSLGFLGEPMLGPAIPGVAKIVVGDTTLIRAYGTLPHPNVLAGFLLLGLFAFYYLWLRRPSEWKFFDSFRNLGSDLIVSLGIFVVALGLLLTFSRTGWAIAVMLTLVIGIGNALSALHRRQGVRLLILMGAIVIILQAQFGGYIAARAQVSSAEPAVTLRVAYSQIGIDIARHNLLGVGVGNQALYAKQTGEYVRFGLTETWQHQPVHNIYLLIADEIGIIGLLAFIVFVGAALMRRPFFTVPKAMFVALLLFGMADHFLWTSVPGQLMLWLVLGIVIGV